MSLSNSCFQSDELHGSVTLKGKVGERRLEFELPMSRATVMADSERQPLHRLAAKAQIKLLEDKEVAGRCLFVATIEMDHTK